MTSSPPKAFGLVIYRQPNRSWPQPGPSTSPLKKVDTMPSSINPDDSPEWPRTCSKCDITLSNIQSWEQHLRSSTHLGSRHVEAKCDDCGQSFTRKGGLKKHRQGRRCDARKKRDWAESPPSKRLKQDICERIATPLFGTSCFLDDTFDKERFTDPRSPELLWGSGTWATSGQPAECPPKTFDNHTDALWTDLFATSDAGESSTPFQHPTLRQKIEARLAGGARITIRSTKAVGATSKYWDHRAPCPLCQKRLPPGADASITHLLKHLNAVDEHPCEECQIIFPTANDLAWHMTSARKNRTCGFAFDHTTKKCNSGHHPPTRELLETSASDDHYRLQLWCLATWRTAGNSNFMSNLALLWEDVSPFDSRISTAWSIGNACRNPGSQVSEDILTSVMESLSLSQQSECALGAAERRIAISRHSTKARLETQELLMPLLEGQTLAHQMKLASDLLLACRRNDVHGVRLCIEAGMDIDLSPSANDKTALYIAASLGHTTIVKLLLEAGAYIHNDNRGHGTALLAAILHRRPTMLSLLLRHGADPYNVKGTRTALDVAIEHTCYEIAEIIIFDELSCGGPMLEFYAAIVFSALSRMPLKLLELSYDHDANLQSVLRMLCSDLPNFEPEDKTVHQLMQGCAKLAGDYIPLRCADQDCRYWTHGIAIHSANCFHSRSIS